MAHIFTKCADLGRTIIRLDRDISTDRTVLGAIPWLIALCNHFKIDFQEAVVQRFPESCSYCLTKPCTCDKTGMKARKRGGTLYTQVELDEELRHRSLSVLNSTTHVDFSWVLDDVSAIYPINRALLQRGGGSFIVSKMLEEGGELHRAFSNHLARKGAIKDIGTEVADLLAWIITCWDTRGTGANIDSELARVFIEGCPTCSSSPCKCPDYSITPTPEDIIREIEEQLTALRGLGVDTKELSDAIALASDSDTKDNSAKGRSLVEKVEGVAKAAEGAERVAGAATGILAKLARAAALLQHLI